MRLIVSKKSIDLIIFAEVSSQAYYDKFLQKPVWPKGASGVTIGVGYDLGHNTAAQIIKDLTDLVSPEELDTLVKCAGIRGEAAKKHLASDAKLRAIRFPLDKAKVLFYQRTLPRYAAMTRGLWPGLELLKPDAIGALISIVFNRGTSINGASRAEMKNIIPLVKNQDYAGIAKQITAMKRLWVGKGLDGLLDRRDAEAKFVQLAVRQYSADELIGITI